MSTKPYIVLGEAQESDSEEEIDVSAASDNQFTDCKGKVISGEAPESDDETSDMSSSAPARDNSNSTNVDWPKRKPRHKSILLKKLYERNMGLHKDLTDFIRQTATNAGNELNVTNQRLLKCQIQMQEGVELFKILNSNLTLLQSNLSSLLTAQHLPDIKVSDAI